MNNKTEILKISTFLLITYSLFLLVIKACDSINYSNCVGYMSNSANVEKVKVYEAILK